MVKKLTKKVLRNVKHIIKGNQNSVHNQPDKPKYTVYTEDAGRQQDKRVMVTGGTGAIGSAICARLFYEGATVGVCGRNRGKITETIDRIKADFPDATGRLFPLELDVTDYNSIEQAIDSFCGAFGGLDYFINNAGGSARGQNKPVYQQEIRVIQDVINTNLMGSILCARKALGKMILQNAGCIINMSSVVGMNGKATMSDYAAAKSGIIGFTKSLALEMGEFNIRVNCISPGMVNQTPFDMGLESKPVETNCLKRMGYTSEVASLVSFILSDEARYITGHNFVIDGGRTLGLKGD